MLPRVDLIGLCLPWCYKTLDSGGQQTDSDSDLYCGIEERAASLVAGMRVCLILIREMPCRQVRPYFTIPSGSLRKT